MNNYLENVRAGKNQWWRYVLTILSLLIAFVLTNLIINQFMPMIKEVFPSDDWGKELRLFILLGLIFGVGLLTFMVAYQKLHHQRFISLVSSDNKFNWLSYAKGFVIWAILLFVGELITDYQLFQNFLEKFDAFHFITLALVGFLTIGIQSFFEEILIRGYFLQGLSLKIKSTRVLIAVNALIFAILHLGYSIESFLGALSFGIAFAIIVIYQERIEFVSGAHNANNLLLSLVFLDLNDVMQEQFSWQIDWFRLGVLIAITALLPLFVYKTSIKKTIHD